MAKALYIPIKAEVAQVMLAHAFDESVRTGAPVKPWSWADTAPMAKVTLPRQGVSEIVLLGGSGEAMAFGPTALVDARARGLTILAAHRDTHFTFMRDLKAGDALTFTRIDGSVERYEVTHLETVRWDEFTYPAGSETGLLALTTCFPFDTHEPGPLRRVAWAKRVSG
ncbi:sortase [uncultured Erythrobacter sp.]|uniref:sortase domain-containing protein n=1 Tax=uncultured Erythrobacter sp. TaxID=263913 RepID=UPI002611FF06|nr:sortase [uncultured Erythrobacter sp.]